MLDNLCKSRTHFSKWKCGKELRVNKHSSRRMESADQILARWGVQGGFSPDRGVDHGDQGGGYLDYLDSTHEGRGDEAGEIADDPAPQRYYGRVAPIPFFEHPVGEPGPAFTGLARLPGGDGQDVRAILFELLADLFRVQRADVGIRDDGVPMGGGELAGNGAGLGQESGGNPDRGPAKPDLAWRCGPAGFP